MSTGWDAGGSSRLICTDPGAENFSADVFAGEAPWRGSSPTVTPPSIALGTADLSIEFWAKWKYGDSPGDDFNFYTGFLAGSSARPGVGIRWLTTVDQGADAWFDVTPSGSPSASRINSATAGQLGQWSYFVINADRSGNMEFLIDEVSKGTVDINANHAGDMGTLGFYPLIGEDTLTLGYNQNFADGPNSWTNNIISPVVIGPIATHNRLLTAAERALSFEGKTIQLLGSSVTQIAYRTWSVRGETGWDTDLAHMLNSFRVGASTPIASPTGVQGSVFVEDESGNGNDLEIPVAASYSTDGANVTAVAASKANFFLGTDGFFS